MDSSIRSIPPNLILDSLSFLDTFLICAADKRFYQICRSNEYWQYRAKVNDVLGPYFLSTQIFDPRIRFAWTMIIGNRVLTDPSTAIYLSRNKRILFPGLEYLLGMRRFLFRAVEHDDLPIIKYGLIHDLPYHLIYDTMVFSVEIDRRDLARYLANTAGDWSEYNARYHPHSDMSINLLAKYGHSDLLTPEDDEDRIQQFIGFLESSKVNANLNGIARAHDLLRKHPNIISIENEYVGTYVGSYGSLSLIESYANLLDVYQDTDEDLEYMLAGAIDHDRVDVVRYLFDRYPDTDFDLFTGNSEPLIDEIRSEQMLRLIKGRYVDGNCLRDPDIDRQINSAVIRGGNYQLIFKILDYINFDSTRVDLNLNLNGSLETFNIPPLIKVILSVPGFVRSLEMGNVVP